MTIAQNIYQKVQNLSVENAQTVLKFVNFLQLQSPKEINNKTANDIAQYAGMVNLPKTGEPRNLDDFNLPKADIHLKEEEVK